ncbi:cellulose synthase/poly-beta-1,6-N-acetylglucosamine synthase-like glycosyltransferase [Wenyingzhuangia heitensis]|uniref:Cellulose synthase/poly-beta-1,6-N-acetylglucosamine synthase-like glycosyltransferase n=1 Tax=Wenyingzhuangia heitensis TaxID=1487859 RepID=A0ABX0UA80_9FLAO|nr:glycosyltransferase family 2 protein [Wenyingzhuangia heitensis]NIJ45717.1 cellulose synthase/poly-beta-1,6-N-acetylglucosamine synthase-like glycosyltransferase [Wenyingzhuangia heitensis]
MNWINNTPFFILQLIGFYIVLSVIIHVCIAITSILKNQIYLNRKEFTDYNTLASSSNAPNISVIKVIYNQENTILQSVKLLLLSHYNNLEIIIINNGSTDNSLQNLIKTYNLKPINVYINKEIDSGPVKTIYKSTNPIYKKLIIVDKPISNNADSLNTGINIASGKYITHINTNYVIKQDAILKLSKPFLKETTQKVIASGSVIKYAENKKSATILSRIISLKHTRILLLEYMAWTKVNELLFTPGLFMIFDREIAIKCKGYTPNTSSLDMELTMRMRQYMEEHKTAYTISFIPDILCWKKEEINFKNILTKKSNWTLKKLESLKSNKKIIFNRKYGTLGLVSYPYWFLFKFLTPIVKVITFIYLLVLGSTKQISWLSIISLGVLLYSLKITYSFIAILTKIITQHKNNQNNSVVKQIVAAILEPIIFTPIVIFSFFKGSLQYFTKK